ncbi:helix-turn-helix domain-containing protein [Pseudarthrobacter sp. Y6]|uniref:helix-turn-helix domain-containing protein n=1 Tax=Pseudarthrobacter sp. Y6 TaxID=3418422 RepID=UPI003CF097E0
MENIEKRLGSVVKSLRLAAGMTQENLAKQLTAAGLPTKQNTVAKLEGGLRPTTVPELGALAKIFKCSIEEFAGWIFPEHEDEAAVAAARADLALQAAVVETLRNSANEANMRFMEIQTRLLDEQAKYDEMEARLSNSAAFKSDP